MVVRPSKGEIISINHKNGLGFANTDTCFNPYENGTKTCVKRMLNLKTGF